ncbi:leucine-rich repeat-containing protein 15-like [Cylas formicarius]|uniref:leucine-rich repeat-containing protein 15-like n=1 Tax=Cylas formicarius TaxID=197179 RepID=UPI002958D394|nr:leucine-rich repeat-containing protein 15-like [Cylas formicarius]
MYIATFLWFSFLKISSNLSPIWDVNYNKKSPPIKACFYPQTGVSNFCQSLPNYSAIKNLSTSTGYKKIEIRHQIVENLERGSLSGILTVKEFAIQHSNLSDIQPGAFERSLSLLLLDFRHNKLEAVKTGTFNDLLISTLNLSHNRIKFIEDDALSYMSNLEEIYLAHNLLTKFNNAWFHKTQRLRELHLENNFFTVIPNDVFRNLRGQLFNPNIYLSFNKITVVHSLAFRGMDNIRIGKLFLDNNFIKVWNENSSSNVNELKLSFNNVTCIHGDVRETAKLGSVENFEHNPYNCTCLKDIKSAFDSSGQQSAWFREQYLICRDGNKMKKARRDSDVEIFHSP